MSQSIQQDRSSRANVNENVALQQLHSALAAATTADPTQAGLFATLRSAGIVRGRRDDLVKSQELVQTAVASLVKAGKMTAHLSFHTPHFAKPAVNTAESLERRSDALASTHRKQVQSFAQLAESGQDIALIASEPATRQALEEAATHADDPNWFTSTNLQALNNNLQLYPTVHASLVPAMPPESIGATYVMRVGGEQAVFAIRTHQAQGEPTGEEPAVICADAKASPAQACLKQVADLQNIARPYDKGTDFQPGAGHSV